MATPSTTYVRDKDTGTPVKIPTAAFDPQKHALSRACPTVEVKDKGAKAGAESYVVNATDFDPKKHDKV